MLITDDDVLHLVPVGGRRRVRPRRDGCASRSTRTRARPLVFADGTGSVYLADMSGDGLTDLVRVRNGEVCYWPNLGYGRFGAKIMMDGAPLFDDPDQFDQRRIRLADIDGSGTADLVYLGARAVTIWFNQSGNSWTRGHELPQFPARRQRRRRERRSTCSAAAPPAWCGPPRCRATRRSRCATST